MPPPLEIPAEYRPGVKKIADLSEPEFKAISEGLCAADFSFYESELAEDVARRVTTMLATDVQEMVEAVWAIEFVRSYGDIPVDEFLVSLSTSMVRLGLVDASNAATVSKRFQALLACQSLAVPSKARSLLREGNSYCRAKVLSDIRPVFGSDGDPSDAKAALIVHNLRLSYHDGPRIKDIMVALDTDDLTKLEAVLRRAKAKEAKLKSFLTASGLRYLDAEE